MTGQEDAIAALAHTLDSLDSHIRTVDATAKRSEKNRLSMLHLHAAAAVVIGPLFAAIGRDGMVGATWTVTRMIPGAPFTLGVILFVGGAILGPATWFRVLFWEKIGLWMLLVWYATIAVSFAAAVVLWLLQGAPPNRPALYAPAVYAHLAIIMVVHLTTLRRIARSRRQAPV